MNGGGGRVVQCNIEESRGKRGSLATLTHFYVCPSVRPSTSVSDVSRSCRAKAESLPRPRPHPSQHRDNTVYWLWPWCHTDALVYMPSCLKPAYTGKWWTSITCLQEQGQGTSRPRPHPSRPSVCQPTFQFHMSLHLHIPFSYFTRRTAWLTKSVIILWWFHSLSYLQR